MHGAEVDAVSVCDAGEGLAVLVQSDRVVDFGWGPGPRRRRVTPWRCRWRDAVVRWIPNCSANSYTVAPAWYCRTSLSVSATDSFLPDVGWLGGVSHLGSVVTCAGVAACPRWWLARDWPFLVEGSSPG